MWEVEYMVWYSVKVFELRDRYLWLVSIWLLLRALGKDGYRNRV